MLTTFSEREVSLGNFAARNSANKKRLEEALAQAAAAEADATAMQSAYTALIADINADASANPADVAYAQHKAKKDKLVADGQAIKTRATAVKSAITGVP